MGLGKTLQALSFISNARSAGRKIKALITVCVSYRYMVYNANDWTDCLLETSCCTHEDQGVLG
jgi:hypothetical protein